MFFNSYTSSQSKKRDLIDSFYYKIVNVSRSKDFYEKLLVPDTIDGRYDLLVLFSDTPPMFATKRRIHFEDLIDVYFFSKK